MDLVLERAGAEDIPQILPLLQALFSLEEDFDFDPQKARWALERLIDDTSRSCVLVARFEGRIVGLSSAQLVISTAQGANSAWIEDVVVQDGFQGMGIGKTLLAALEQWCRDNGASRLQLLADRNNRPAQTFYRRTGWKDTNLIVLKKYV